MKITFLEIFQTLLLGSLVTFVLTDHVGWAIVSLVLLLGVGEQNKDKE